MGKHNGGRSRGRKPDERPQSLEGPRYGKRAERLREKEAKLKNTLSSKARWRRQERRKQVRERMKGMQVNDATRNDTLTEAAGAATTIGVGTYQPPVGTVEDWGGVEWEKCADGIWRRLDRDKTSDVAPLGGDDDDTGRYADYWQGKRRGNDLTGGRAAWFGRDVGDDTNPRMAPVADSGNMLFVFGTLMNAGTRNLMLDRTYDYAPIPAALFGYRKTGALMIAPAEQGSGDTPADRQVNSPHFVPGQLLVDLSKADMINLDAYEGIHADSSGAYKRELVKVAISPADALGLGLSVPDLADEEVGEAATVEELLALDTLVLIDAHAYTSAYADQYIVGPRSWDEDDERGGVGYVDPLLSGPKAQTATATTRGIAAANGWAGGDRIGYDEADDWGDEVDDDSTPGASEAEWDRAQERWLTNGYGRYKNLSVRQDGTVVDEGDGDDNGPGLPRVTVEELAERIAQGGEVDADKLEPEVLAQLIEIMNFDANSAGKLVDTNGNPIEVIDLTGETADAG